METILHHLCFYDVVPRGLIELYGSGKCDIIGKLWVYHVHAGFRCSFITVNIVFGTIGVVLEACSTFSAYSFVNELEDNGLN